MMNPARGSGQSDRAGRLVGLAAVDPGLLRLAGPARFDRDATPCVLLVHNEMTILPELLDHYRRCGPVSFLVVDDRSTDATPAFLAAQPDVTVFHPAEGTRYSTHKRDWRGTLLDAVAEGRWALAPDADEFLHYPGLLGGGLPALLSDLDREGTEALHATMVDMYADRPLADHVYAGGGLLDAFPLFDGPVSYRLLASPTRFASGYPCPRALVFGGLRERLFNRRAGPAPFQSWLLRHFARLDGSFTPGALSRELSALTRRATQRLWTEAFVCSKVPLVKWRRGLRFSGGAHAVSRPLRLSDRSAVLLHFKFTRGAEGLARIAERGEHVGGARHYRHMLGQQAVIGRSPVGPPTRRFDGPDGFGLLLR